MVNATHRPLYPWERPGAYHIGGWAPGPVWTGAENLAPTGIRSPDRPDRSQSLYRQRQKNVFNPLKAELNPICHLLALLGAHHIFHVSRIRVNYNLKISRKIIYILFIMHTKLHKIVTQNIEEERNLVRHYNFVF